MEHPRPKRVVVSSAAVKKAAARSTRASAKLEGRVVPTGYQRSAAAEAYLAKRSSSRNPDDAR